MTQNSSRCDAWVGVRQARRLPVFRLAWIGAICAAALSAMPAPALAQAIDKRPQMITAEAEKAIKKGLAYLAREQRRDGSWRSNTYGGYPTAMTSLAGLALLSGGSTPLEGPHAENIRRAIKYLLDNSNANQSGLIARLNEERSCMHGHGFAILFLAQAYGMERDTVRQQQIEKALVRAIRLTGQSQSAAGGWLYTPNSGGDEGSVTVTQIQGLRACRNAGIKVPDTIIKRACEYINRSAQPDGGIAYRAGMSGSRPPITAAAVAVMYSAGEYEHPVAKRALEYIKKLLKSNRNQLGGGHQFYSMMYTAQAMYLSSEENWKSYFPTQRDDLVRSQQGNGMWQGEAGDVFGTSIALLTLQLPYGNLPIFQR